ncbi:MAG: putative Ig domain-containing protein [Candidatus Brockarchaeota archaeon]|nr:putative Ig domain-containing protein [Candidatus Brockarchaeota archaeon]
MTVMVRALLLLTLFSLMLVSATPVFASPGIKPDALPAGRVGAFYQVILSWEGHQQPPPITWFLVSGSLPPGLRLETLADGSGYIYGTPTQGGTYEFRVRAQQPFGLIAIIKEEKDYAVSIAGLGIHPESLPEATEETGYDAKINVVGGTPPYDWGITGLPPGLRWGYLDLRDKEVVAIHGSPEAGSAGNYSVTVTVRDNKGNVISRTYVLTVKEPPWDYSVTITRLTSEGESSRATVYIDELIIAPGTLPVDFSTGKPYLAEDVFEVRLHRTSGRGDKHVELFLSIPETTPPGVTVEMESPWRGEFGNTDLVRRISVKVDKRYLSLHESFTTKDVPRNLVVKVTGVRNETHPLTVTIKGLKIDVYFGYPKSWQAEPIQVVESYGEKESLVEGKSTVFKTQVWVVCSRTPRVDVSFKVALELPFEDWDWDIPDWSSGTNGLSYVTVSIPRTEIVLPSGASWTTLVSRTIYIPTVHSQAVFEYFYVSFPLSMPRPRLTPSRTVRYKLYVDAGADISEWHEDNNLYEGTWPVVRTRRLHLLFVPWVNDDEELYAALGLFPNVPPYAPYRLGDYFYNGSGLWGEWTPDVCVKFPVSTSDFTNITETYRIKARALAEYVQATYPIAELELTYSVRPVWIDLEAPGLPIMILKNRDHGRVLREVARLARIYGYDAGVAMRICGSGGQSRGVKWAVFTDVFAPVTTLAHELYHLLGPMNYDDYDQHPADAGYWVNKGQVRGQGESYFMAGFELTAPGTLLGGTNDAERSWPPYFEWAWESSHWITLQMYKRLMEGWFNPENSRDPLAILVGGAVFKNGSAFFEPFLVQEAEIDLLPGSAGDHHIVFLDKEGRVLKRFGFNASFLVFDSPLENQEDESYFNYYLEAVDGIRAIELTDSSGRTLARREVSENPPTLRLKFPLGGERLTNLRSSKTWISWEASDPDGDTLYYYVAISPDNGITWLPLEVDYMGTSLGFGAWCFEPGDKYLVNVKVSDGFHTMEVLSKPFSIGPYVELKVLSEIGGVNGSGWYLKGEEATFNVLFTKKTMDGLLGLLGGYYEFTGWGGDLVSKETRVAVTMDSDKTVKAMFRADYTMPLIYVAILVTILFLTVFIIARVLKARRPLPPPPVE